MTKVSFLHGAADRIQAATQWLHQAWGQRQPVLVYVPVAEDATRLDRFLWSQPPLSFTPHCSSASPLAHETPIILTQDLDSPPHETCLLNLSNELPVAFSRFEHMVEIISTHDSERLPARERFKFYRDRGYAIENRDISGGI